MGVKTPMTKVRPRNLWQDRIVKTPNTLGGKPRIKGTRLSVELIAGLFGGSRSIARSWTPTRT